MKISIIFENNTKKNLECGWGFSAMVEKGGETLLFDTGNCGTDILTNLEVMGFDIGKLSRVVISHDHWDHTGGIFELLKVKKGITFYTGEDLGKIYSEEVERRGGKVSKGKDWRQLTEDIYLTPELAGDIPEQALVINNENFVFLLLGCSHPGVEKFIKITHGRFKKPICFAGGFHYFPLSGKKISQKIKKINKFPILRVFPMHCTGAKGVELLKESFLVSELSTGDVIDDKACMAGR
jgi:7,8-dihydropterin-6-yl-methyl-4-(beta-D-ribofuranosyl)aminobenzene 5'-phosphate synthase